MKQDPLRFGIIGTSNIADIPRAPALQRVAGVTLWSVLSREHARAEQFARKHGAMSPHPAYSDLSDFLSDPQLQAVIITSPDNLHGQHILQRARAGKHVLVEKSLVTSHEEGAEIISACRKRDVKLGVSMHLRWHAAHRKLHPLILEDGVLGKLRHIRI
ncbi:Gfo/Idh/MocA family protein [Bradyrhizobium sp. CCBAU 51753]|uniref:Gfo/Idh/MocA family protein n=1 Tax=Bradyrhizobium sp. CCBAU 51753 TaxID=1325100 RepID=UPI00188DAC01|nr:hypothetical protein XH93_09805 [Bradyrhizobium sp. CCBAU 51753]